MSHFVQGLIANQACFQACCNIAPRSRIAALEQGFGLLLVSNGSDRRYEDAATPNIVATARELSYCAPVAFVETEYFGGMGGQKAELWKNGVVVRSVAENNLTAAASTAPQDSPINTILRELGVKAGQHLDEFGTIGLGRFRCNQDWLASIDDSVVRNG